MVWVELSEQMNFSGFVFAGGSHRKSRECAQSILLNVGRSVAFYELPELVVEVREIWLDLLDWTVARLKDVRQGGASVSDNSWHVVPQSSANHWHHIVQILNLEVWGHIVGKLSESVTAGVPYSWIFIINKFSDSHNDRGDFINLADVLSELGNGHEGRVLHFPVVAGEQSLDAV